ncbi:ATP synthase subunit I [Clostridiisalibacter paucivorans]|uniref:ATP synthase subunit I n=1 Tax=Clostridiisalibacter paucivorans TaxID=408753 RepID=UPI000687132A|nr:ATP synthase subunit I [Clostridiisalibacter paucivorans]
MGATDDIFKSIVKKLLITDLILFLVFFIFTENPKQWILGLLFSSIFSVLNFRLLAISIEKSVTMKPTKATIYAVSTYIIRYALTGLIVVIGFKAEYLNPLAVIIGLLLIKAVIIVDNTRKK